MNYIKALSNRLILGGLLSTIVLNALPVRKALIIGNDNYPGNALRNARNDATAVTHALTSLGYSTTLQLDASREVMGEALSGFAKDLHPGDTVIFYYAGHGMQVDGENFLIPVDFHSASPGDARAQAYSLSEILNTFIAHGATTNVVILDACRDNPFAALRGIRGGWASMATSVGTFLAFATAPGSTAADMPSQAHGLFTKALLANLSSSLDIEQMFEKVREQVIQESNGLQIPWIASSLVGTLHIIPQLDSALAASLPNIPMVLNPIQTPPVAQRSAALPIASAQTAVNPQTEPSPSATVSATTTAGANSAKILVDQGLLLAEQQDYEGAVRGLSAALVADPTYSIALRVLGLVFHLLGKGADAIQVLTRAVSLDPSDPLIYYYRCLALTATDPADAMRDCEASVGITPDFAPAHVGIANALLGLGQAQRAYSEASEAIQLDPTSPLGYAIRGRIDAVLGKYSAAQQDYAAAVSLTPVSATQ